MHILRKFTLLAVAMLLLLGSITACSSTAGKTEHAIHMAPLHEMPLEVQQARVVVQQAYQFAVANPELMKDLPCYCGCGAIGHTSNYACYVADVDQNGLIKFDGHALGCTICVDITQDAMRMLRQGHDASSILAYVNQTYAKYGSSNMP